MKESPPPAEPDSYLSTSAGARSPRRALAFSFLDRYSGLVIGVVSSMVIARLLKPHEIGIFSVAMALLMLANTVRDVGAGQFIVQAKALTDDLVRAVWAIQLTVGALLAALVAALAIPLSLLYDEPQLSPILWIMAAAYLFNPFGSITFAFLMRDMRFEHVAIMRFVSATTGAAVSITLALNGFGPISLAWGSLASTASNALTALAFRPRGLPWRPGLRGVPEVLGFGSRIAASSVVGTLVTSSPDFLLGKMQGMAAAGFFSRSNGLVNMFARLVTDAVYGVAFSLFAQQRRAGASMVPGFLRALSYMAVLQMSFAISLALLAHPVTRLLYGVQWDDSVVLTRWLALGAAFTAPVAMCVAACTAAGRADLTLRATLLAGGVTLTCVFVGALGNLASLGQAMALAAAVSSAIWLMVTRTIVAFRGRDLLAVITRSAGVALLAGVGPLATVVVWGLTPESAVLPVLAGGLSAALGLVAGLLLLKHPLSHELYRLTGFATRLWRPNVDRGP